MHGLCLECAQVIQCIILITCIVHVFCSLVSYIKQHKGLMLAMNMNFSYSKMFPYLKMKLFSAVSLHEKTFIFIDITIFIVSSTPLTLTICPTNKLKHFTKLQWKAFSKRSRRKIANKRRNARVVSERKADQLKKSLLWSVIRVVLETMSLFNRRTKRVQANWASSLGLAVAHHSYPVKV